MYTFFKENGKNQLNIKSTIPQQGLTMARFFCDIFSGYSEMMEKISL